MGIIAGIVVMASRGKGPIIRNDAGALGSPERNFAHTPRWVDVVYTWVNGSHPTAELQLEAAIKADVLPYRPHSSRFRDDGLFEFALRSLLVADGLMRSVRNVYIVTSGEIPSFLPVQRLHPVGAHDTNSTGDDRGGSASCHVQDGFTTTTLSMPLRPLIEASGGSTARHGGGMNRKLFIVPHSALFPAPAEELPTFNSNSILAVIHRIPRLGRWFLYSDDDCIINNKNTVPSSRVEFLFAHRCANAEGEARCRKLLESHHSDFVTFNDDATKMSTLESGLVVLHRLLREQFGTFSTTT